MEPHIASLEAKISEVAALCRRLRADNEALQTQLNAATADRDLIAQKLDSARRRLEALVEHLPTS